MEMPFQAVVRTVNTLYVAVNWPDNLSLLSLFFCNVPNNITVTRRQNAFALYQDFLQLRVGAGEAPKGLEQAFAASIEISPSMWSQLKSSRPIGDKLARQIEKHAGKKAGWLDEPHDDQVLVDPAEERFVQAARAAWRQANSKQKRELSALIKGAAAKG